MPLASTAACRRRSRFRHEHRAAAGQRWGGPALFYYLGDPDWSDQYPFVPEQQAVRT